MQGISAATAVAGGRDMSYAVVGGQVLAWGSDTYGELGGAVAEGVGRSLVPVAVPGLADVKEVVAGRNHALALRRDGTVWAWGQNAAGQLGDGTRSTRRTPVQVTGLAGVVALAAGADHSVAVLGDGRVATWGEGSRGQLGHGTRADWLAPHVVSGVSGATRAAAGRDHTLVVAGASRSLLRWGHNDLGQLGDTTTAIRTAPVSTPGVTGVRDIGGGRGYTVVLRDA